MIPFQLDNIPEEGEQIPESTRVESATTATNQPLTTVIGCGPQESHLSVDSEIDVKFFRRCNGLIFAKGSVSHPRGI